MHGEMEGEYWDNDSPDMTHRLFLDEDEMLLEI